MSSVSRWRFYLATTAWVVPVTITVLDIFGYVAKVEGASMQPVLNPTPRRADYVLLNRWGARSYNFQRGEVVSLATRSGKIGSPTSPGEKLIKRIIALEGDTVTTLSYKNRHVKIPEGHCWLEGDHHGMSHDSNLFGPVAVALINARASYIVWPPSRWQRLPVSVPLDRLKLRQDRTLENCLEPVAAS